MSDKNTCSVCLEPLWQATTNDNAVGAVVPCGHCFHFECFALWRASKGRDCKCPNCNKPSKECIKIFIDPPDASMMRLDNDDDDVSLHSTDSNPVASEEETQQENGDSDAVAEESQIAPELESVDDNLIDLTLSPALLPPVQAAASSASRSIPTASFDSGDEVKRFKCIAKRYKRKFQQKNTQFQEQYQQHQALIQKHSQMKAQVEGMKEELCAQNELDEQNAARLDAANLRVVQLQQQCHQQTARIRTLEDQNCGLESRHSKLQKDFSKAVEKARHSDMAEVQELLRERPVIVEENQNLKRDIAKVTNELSDLRRLLRTSGTHSTTGRTTTSAAMAASSVGTSTRGVKTTPPLAAARSFAIPVIRSSPTKKRKASSLAKELRAMASVQYVNENVNVNANLHGSPLEEEEATSGRTSVLHTNQNLSSAGNRMALFFHRKQQQQQQSKQSRSGDNRIGLARMSVNHINARDSTLEGSSCQPIGVLRTEDSLQRTGINLHSKRKNHRLPGKYD